MKPNKFRFILENCSNNLIRCRRRLMLLTFQLSSFFPIYGRKLKSMFYFRDYFRCVFAKILLNQICPFFNFSSPINYYKINIFIKKRSEFKFLYCFLYNYSNVCECLNYLYSKLLRQDMFFFLFK